MINYFFEARKMQNYRQKKDLFSHQQFFFSKINIKLNIGISFIESIVLS